MNDCLAKKIGAVNGLLLGMEFASPTQLVMIEAQQRAVAAK